MSELSEFPQYPRAVMDDGGPRFIVIYTEVRGAGANQRTTISTSKPLSESTALDALSALCAGAQVPGVDIRDDDTIVSISDRELLVFGESFWTGGRHTRIQIGQVVPRPPGREPAVRDEFQS